MNKFNELYESAMNIPPKVLKWKKINRGTYTTGKFEIYYNEEIREYELRENDEWWETFKTLKNAKVYAEFLNRDKKTENYWKWLRG